jgi:ligand-binding sensor domain-containing protein
VAHDPAGGLWLATAHGAGRLDEEGFHGYPAANASVARSVSVDRSGRPWFALVRAGVYRLQEGSLRHEPSVMHGLDATAVLHDRRGDLWVGTLSGLHRFHGAHQRWPELGRVHCILEDAEGLVWVGTDQGGLYRFEPKPGRQEAPSH